MSRLFIGTISHRTLCSLILFSFALLWAQMPARAGTPAFTGPSLAQNNRRSASRASRKQSKVATLTKEAEAEANKHWNVIITKCGDSYYMKEARFIYQLKGVSFSVIANAPSEAEELNGVGGRANAQVHVKVGRRYDTDFHYWGEWSERFGPSGSGYWLVKKNGVWRALLPKPVSAIDCAKIPS